MIHRLINPVLHVAFPNHQILGSAQLTAVQLLWVNLIIDTLGALALATEPPNNGLMMQQPVKRTDSFITKMMWRNITGQSIYQMDVLFVLNFIGKPILNLQGPNSTAILNTFIFNNFVFCQVFNEINSCDIDKINIFRGIFSRWIFVGVMISTIVFQVIIVEFLGTFVSSLAKAIRVIAKLEEPIGQVLKRTELSDGFILEKMSSPLGVLLIIFESQPEALVQVAGGLAGETPHMISATVKGITPLTYEFTYLVSTVFSVLPSYFFFFKEKT
ncbi:putative calcium-transporting ATPase 11, plasma membrane-type [Lactuca sativa]|uniref:putative calcium-transporting ATPase 11, plasma membrane-type n=1 Tax=Lactuca sativa TaxID=4236 RepID=UPI0022AF8040|nr:putative calcium-transporting ATPase 11, plasma membrane-type [Lactuca sativa]